LNAAAATPVQRALPPWAERMRDKYLAGEASVFVLHRNIFDEMMVGGRDQRSRFVSLEEYLVHHFLAATRKRIFIQRVGHRVEQCEVSDGGEVLPPRPEDVGHFYSLRRAIFGAEPTALVIPYADAVFPATDMALLGTDERRAVTELHRWSMDRKLQSSDTLIILLVESLAALNPILLSSPKVAVVEIDYPDLAARGQVLDQLASHLDPAHRERLAHHTAGLRTVAIRHIVEPSAGRGLSYEDRLELLETVFDPSDDGKKRAHLFANITAGMGREDIRDLMGPLADGSVDMPDPIEQMLQLVDQRKREIIEKECAGLVELIMPKHGLDAVGGNEAIKQELAGIARRFKDADPRFSPMGLLAVGAMGSGKTFVIKAFLKEAGLNGVAFKNFRSKWVGSTEANLERVLATVKAMGPTAVIIDEGDRSFGKSEGDSDSGTSSRVIARLKEFMSDTENRGRVLFILMTNRPDKLDTDIKRPGRLDRKIPFFYAQSDEERGDVLASILSRHGAPLTLADEAQRARFLGIMARLEGYSNADLEAVALLAVDMAYTDGTGASLDVLERAVDDFMPPQERSMIEYMDWLAVSEASRKSLLPQKYRDCTADQVQARLSSLRTALGIR